MTDVDELLKIFDIEDEKLFRLKVLEILGELVLMMHWVRGTFGSLFFWELIKYPDERYGTNFERVQGDLELYEALIWELAPSRAALVALQCATRGGDVNLEELRQLLIKDAHGRIPYGTSAKAVDDIEDILRRLGDTRIELLKRKEAGVVNK